jgi:MOSC domain-containing protein YiiM
VASAKVVGLFVQPKKHAASVSRTRVTAVPGAGLLDDKHAKRKPTKREVLLLEETTPIALGLPPGALREQITIAAGLDLMALPAGTRLRVGEALLEVTEECEPCIRIGRMLGVEDPESFQRALERRRGMMTRVLEGGDIAIGDDVREEPQPAASPNR